MKPTLIAILVAVALSLAAGAQATERVAADSGASSVADMLQRKHDTELRAQLVTAGRWEEIKKMDAVTAQHLQAQREQRYLEVNEQLGHSKGVEGQPIDSRALDCDPDAAHVR